MKYLLILSFVFHGAFPLCAESNIRQEDSEYHPPTLGWFESILSLGVGAALTYKQYNLAIGMGGIVIGMIGAKIVNDPYCFAQITETVEAGRNYTRDTLVPSLVSTVSNNFWYLSFLAVNVGAYVILNNNLHILRYEDRSKFLQCPVCWNNLVNVVFSGCGHTVCASCLPHIKECPQCRGSIVSFVKFFIPGEGS